MSGHRFGGGRAHPAAFGRCRSTRSTFPQSIVLTGLLFGFERTEPKRLGSLKLNGCCIGYRRRAS